MKNLISKRRDGEHSPRIENEPENLKYRKKIKFDVYTEIWEFDTKLEWLQILEETASDYEKVVYTDYEDLNTYHIVDHDAIWWGLENLLKDEQIIKMFDDFIIESGGLPIELEAHLAKFGGGARVQPEDVQTKNKRKKNDNR